MHKLKRRKLYKQAFNIDVIMHKVSKLLLERGAIYVKEDVGALFVGVKSDDEYEYTIRFDIRKKEK